MGFRKFSGLDPQVLGISPNDPVQWARLMEIFNKCRQHSERAPTPSQQGLHLQFYRRALNSSEKLDEMAAVVYLNDLFNPQGKEEIRKILEERAKKDTQRILNEPEQKLVTWMLYSIPSEAIEFCREQFFSRLIGWSLERTQKQNVREKLQAFPQWASQYDELWILYRGRPLKSLVNSMPRKLHLLINELQPKELRKEPDTIPKSTQLADSDYARYLETVPSQLLEDFDNQWALRLQVCKILHDDTRWSEDRCAAVLHSCHPSQTCLEEAYNGGSDWMRRIIQSASKKF